MRRRLPLFLALVSLCLGGLYVYVGLRLAQTALAWVLLGLPFVLTIAMPLLMWREPRPANSPVALFFQRLTFVAMGLGSCILVCCVLRDLALAVSLALPSSEWRLALAGPAGAHAVLLLGLVLTLVGIATAYGGPRIKRVDVPITNLPPALDGFQIAQISDLHVGPTIRRGYVEKVAAKTVRLGADLVALTGDIVDGEFEELKPLIEAFAGLGPAGKVLYVPGNHEYYWNAPVWMEHFKTLGITVLDNKSLQVAHGSARVHVGGVVDPAARMLGEGHGPDLNLAAQGSDGADFKLLLAHQPHLTEDPATYGFQLQLSGHTHGGQFFPWTLVIRFVHKHFNGLARAGQLWIYVNPGTGSWGPPVRIGTIPEISLLRLRSV